MNSSFEKMVYRMGLLMAMAFAMGGTRAELPPDCMPVAYIQAALYDEPKIDTGFVPNPQTDCIEVKVSFLSVATAQTIWCARSTSTDRSWTTFLLPDGLLRTDYHNTNSSKGGGVLGTGTPLEKDVVYTLTMSNNSFRVSNGISFDHADIPTFSSTVNSLCFFCACDSDNGEGTTFSHNMRLHGVKIWRNGELVRDYVPCRKQKDASYVPVLWDCVNDTEVSSRNCCIGPDCSTNIAVRTNCALISGERAVTPDLEVIDTSTGRVLMNGTDYEVRWAGNDAPGTALASVKVRCGSGAYGEMTAPVQVRRDIPAGYIPLAYIQGDGHCRLLTDYVPNPQTDTLKMDYELTRVETSAFACARAADGSKTWSVCMIADKYRFDYLSVPSPSAHHGLIVPGATYSFTLANNTLTFNDGNVISANGDASFTTTYNPLQLYAFYTGGPNGTHATYSHYRTYRCQVWRSGGLIHDWAPVRTPQGIATLVDTVTGDLLTPETDGTPNAGFIEGPVLGRSFITAVVPVQSWNGASPCTPALDVRDAATGASLVAGTDYDVSYAGNDAPGKATATVTGLSSYTGAKSIVSFVVARAVSAEYEPLEYIQGANNAYFVTDYTPNLTADRIEMNLELTQTGINAALFCARNNGNVDSYTVFQQAAGTLRFDYSESTRCQVTKDIGLVVGKRYLLRYAGPSFDFGDDVHGSYFAKSGLAAAGSALHLFSAVPLNYYSTHRLFDCCVWRDGAPLRLWVPVRRISDGVATLYDCMTGSALTPLGGAFLAGPKKANFELFVRNQPWTAGVRFRPVVVATNTLNGTELVRRNDYACAIVTNLASRHGCVTATGCSGSAYAGQSCSRDFAVYPALPEGYERLEYIQGDGNTALITGVTPTPMTGRVLASFMPMDTGTHGLFCARGNGGADRNWSFCTIQEMTFKPRFDYGSNNVTFGAILQPHERICLSLRNNRVELGNGDSLTIEGSGVPEAGGPLALLGYYSMSSGQPMFSTYATHRIYSFQYWQNDALLLDLVPVRTSEGVVTMFDYVSGVALEPTGRSGGSFIAGPVWEVDPMSPVPGLIFTVR